MLTTRSQDERPERTVGSRCLRSAERREGRMGLQQEDHARFAIGRNRDAKAPEQERRAGHMTDTMHLELFPLTSLGPTFQFNQDFVAEFDKDCGHGFGCQIRPQAMRIAEQGHQRAGLPVHMQDAGRRGEEDHARVVRSKLPGCRGQGCWRGVVDGMAGFTEGGS